MATNFSPSEAYLPAQKRGDTWCVAFCWKQSNGQPVDFTGSEVRLQVRHAVSKKLAAVPDSLDIDIPTGTVTATFLKATTEAVKPGPYITDMEVVYSGGTVQSCGTIQLPVIEDVTWPEGP